MRPLAIGAAKDYNLTIDGIRDSAAMDKQTVIATTVACGFGHLAESRIIETQVPIERLGHVQSYVTNGSGTPLWDSVGLAINELEKSFDTQDFETAYLVMVITDGEENASKLWNVNSLKEKIRVMQNTDRWTFVFRVPRGAKARLMGLGIPAGNIMEWEQTESSLSNSTQATVSGVSSYFTARSAGKTKVDTFYADLTNIKPVDIKTLADITGSVKRVMVPDSETGTAIKDFCIKSLGSYDTGKAYYQLSKPETVQEQKKVVILDKTTGKYYTGHSAKSLLGLPSYGSIKLHPGANGNYELYVQSTSVNRKLMGGTFVLYI